MDDETARALIAEGNINELTKQLEDIELDEGKYPDLCASTEHYALQLACYLIQNDLVKLRFLWKRIPQQSKTSPELIALWELAKAIWNRKPVFELLQAGWSPMILPLIAEFTDEYLARYLSQVERAYGNISVEFMTRHTGFPAAKIHEAASQLSHWRFNESKACYHIERKNRGRASFPKQQLEQLARMVSHLEQ